MMSEGSTQSAMASAAACLPRAFERLVFLLGGIFSRVWEEVKP